MKPRIAIPLPTSNDPAYNRLNVSAYADAVTASGGVPLELTLDLSPAEIARIAATCQGILLPGSPADVAPARYGQDVDEATAPQDLPRESIDQLLLEDAYLQRKPILGVCFGVQMLNVFRGGTLIQDLAVMPVNHSAGRAVMVAHTAAIAPHSLLGSLVDPAEATEVDGFLRLPINSSHHQAVGIAGSDLRISARCPQDAVIEAVEGEYTETDPHFVLGVQWHPERTFETSATSRALFSRLIAEAAAWKPAAVAGTAD